MSIVTPRDLSLHAADKLGENNLEIIATDRTAAESTTNRCHQSDKAFLNEQPSYGWRVNHGPAMSIWHSSIAHTDGTLAHVMYANCTALHSGSRILMLLRWITAMAIYDITTRHTRLTTAIHCLSRPPGSPVGRRADMRNTVVRAYSQQKSQ